MLLRMTHMTRILIDQQTVKESTFHDKTSAM